MTGHFVWTLQKAENKIKVALDSGKVDPMTEVIDLKVDITCCVHILLATPVPHLLSTA